MVKPWLVKSLPRLPSPQIDDFLHCHHNTIPCSPEQIPARRAILLGRDKVVFLPGLDFVIFVRKARTVNTSPKVGASNTSFVLAATTAK